MTAHKNSFGTFQILKPLARKIEKRVHAQGFVTIEESHVCKGFFVYIFKNK